MSLRDLHAANAAHDAELWGDELTNYGFDAETDDVEEILDHDISTDTDPDLDELLNEPAPEYDWIINDLVERSDRVILTGEEGRGKSTLCRQFAIRAAAGIHPFEDDIDIDPIRVVFADFENSRNQTRRAFRPLRITVGDRLARGQLIPIIEPAGVDLRRDEDARWLEDNVARNHPDLLVVGPLYKMATGDATAEDIARAVSGVLDHLRTKYGCALLIEGHSPYGASANKRPQRPYGASLWSRWPEFGLHLSQQGQLLHWRGAHDERGWPAVLRRGGDWPWTLETGGKQVASAHILEIVHEIGRAPTVRELAERLGSGKSTVQRAIDANRGQWERTVSAMKGSPK